MKHEQLGPERSGQATWSPDGKTIAFIRYTDDDDILCVMNLQGEWQEISSRSMGAHYPPQGHHRNPAWLSNQTLCVIASSGDIAVINRDGTSYRVIEQKKTPSVDFLTVSPNKGWIAALTHTVHDHAKHVYTIALYSVDESPPRMLIEDNYLGSYQLAWSDDSELIAFESRRGIEVCTLDGSRRLVESRGSQPQFRPCHGNTLSYVLGLNDGDQGLFAIPVSKKKQVSRLTGRLIRNYFWSPTGESLVYEDYGRRKGMWLWDVNNGKERRLEDVFLVTGEHSVWSPDGTKLLFSGTHGKKMTLVSLD